MTDPHFQIFENGVKRYGYISSAIENTDRFALVHVRYTDETVVKMLGGRERFSIVPIIEMDDKCDVEWMNTGKEVYSNDDGNGNYMGMNEMVMNFSIRYGRDVEYEIEYESNGCFSQDKISYMGRLRR